jgi:hypothetical protein
VLLRGTQGSRPRGQRLENPDPIGTIVGARAKVRAAIKDGESGKTHPLQFLLPLYGGQSPNPKWKNLSRKLQRPK